ncbi:MAG: D-alanyl-D-alanine carboxypeptidase [Ruminococcaceae bacterium]|nr:D-alanyl-D-alanine carboxypeptidase [Oscillospiraceae bacterium]
MTAGASQAPDITAKAAMVVNITTNETVYEKDADVQIAPASTVKLMTALTVYKLCDDFSEKIAIPQIAADTSGRSVGFKAGEKISIEELLIALLTASANDAALTLAYHFGGGSTSAFVEQMNSYAAELGLTSTYFKNATGFDAEGQYTTARDMARIAMKAIQLENFVAYSDYVDYTIEASDTNKERTFNSSNYFVSQKLEVKYRYSKASGLNSGSTSKGGQCLVTTAESGDYEYLCIVMGSTKTADSINSYVDAKALLDWAFKSFEFTKVLSKTETITQLAVTLSSDADSVVLVPAEDLRVLAPTEMDESLIKKEVSTPESIEAPVVKGQVLGSVTVSYNDKIYGTVDLVAITGIEKSGFMEYSRNVLDAFGSIWMKIFVFITIALILFYILVIILKNWRPKGAQRKREKTKVSTYDGTKNRRLK